MPIRIIVVSFERMVCPLHYVRSGSLAETRPHTMQAATQLHLHGRISLAWRLAHFSPRSGAAARMPRCAAQQNCAAKADTVDSDRPGQSQTTSAAVTRPSARFSKFVIQRGTLGHELRKPKGTSNSMILVPLFDLKFLRRTCGTRCRNFKSAALGGGAFRRRSAVQPIDSVARP